VINEVRRWLMEQPVLVYCSHFFGRRSRFLFFPRLVSLLTVYQEGAAIDRHDDEMKLHSTPRDPIRAPASLTE
jgi:hypothetical protein